MAVLGQISQIEIVAVLTSLSMLLMFMGMATMRRTNVVRDRIELYSPTSPAPRLEELEMSEPFSRRVLAPVLRRIARVFSWILPNKQLQSIRTRLQEAGYPGGLSEADFVGIKGWAIVICGGLAAGFVYLERDSLEMRSIMMAGGLALVGLVGPDAWLSRKIRERKNELTKALPDALDMLTLSVEAGLSFDQAIAEVASRWDNELTREFRRTLYEIGVGTSRREALENLAQRTSVQDITSFVIAVNHAEELGTSLGHVLRVQSDEMRVRRRQRAEEAAGTLAIKMLFPLVFLIFPALFAMILGPAIPRLFGGLGG